MDHRTLETILKKITKLPEGKRIPVARQTVRRLHRESNDTPKDFLVAAILRIAAIDFGLLYESEVEDRQWALRLVQERLEVLSRRVFDRYGLAGRIQADEMCRKLSDIVPDATTALGQAISTYHGVDSLSELQQNLLRALNRDLIRVSIRHFLGFGTDPSTELNECLRATIAYTRTSDAMQASAALDDAQRRLNKLLDTYAQSQADIGGPIANTLRRILRDLRAHFKNSPYSSPAQLEIQEAPRRYPLHVPNLELSIPVQILNKGEGVAIHVEVSIRESIGLARVEDPRRLSSLYPGASVVIDLHARTNPDDDLEGLCEIQLSWVNADGTDATIVADVALNPQDPKLDWEEARHTNPYSLEAVTDEHQLMGRRQTLDRIVRTLGTKTAGSLYIHGEKRVGKTSLAYVAVHLMENRGVACVFQDVGGINHHIPENAINNLTESLVSKIAGMFPMVSDLAGNMRLDGSLTFLNQLLERVSVLGERLVIVIDEFDRLPARLFRRTDVQDAFFTGLRAISAIRGIGLVLVAGERMNLIISGPGVELNRFAGFPVDYLDRSTQWSDFEDLVRKPTEKLLEFSNEACERVYEYTDGNPYFTKLLCAEILENAMQRTDAFVGTREVDAAVNFLMTRIDPTSFSHYWEDFLLDDDARRDEVTLNRRRCLLAFGLACRLGGSAPIESVIDAGAKVGMDATTTRREIDSLVRRRLVILEDGILQPRIRLFGLWIAGNGQTQMVLTSVELESARSAIDQREKLRVSLDEARKLIQGWGSFRGTTISAERLLCYLEQFGDVRSQRLIFQILVKLDFIGDAQEAELMREAFLHLQNNMRVRHGNWTRDQITISYTGSIGGSGLAMARSFAIVNGFLRTKQIHKPELLRSECGNGVTDVVLVDDFVGSGTTLQSDLQDMAKSVADDQAVHIFLLAGMTAGVDRVADTAREVFGDSRVTIRCLHEIKSAPNPFDLEAGVFESADDAADARRIVEDFGRRLEPKIPLGYGGCCALVTFSRTIPNNAPPILWSGVSGKVFSFEPLFRRNQ